MDTRKVVLTEDGNLEIPASFRRALGISAGDTLIMELEAGELRLRSIAAAVRDVQAHVRTLNPTGRLLSEELIAERRQAAADESASAATPAPSPRSFAPRSGLSQTF